jgi:hypothetical protein
LLNFVGGGDLWMCLWETEEGEVKEPLIMIIFICLDFGAFKESGSGRVDPRMSGFSFPLCLKYQGQNEHEQ